MCEREKGVLEFGKAFALQTKKKVEKKKIKISDLYVFKKRSTESEFC